MRSIKYCASCLIVAAVFAAAFSLAVDAQTAAEVKPRQEKLLNGLKVLIFRVPSANEVTVKIRVHSGSAFDPQSREGVMKLLSESIFPNEAQRSYFSEDLGGSLDITSNYDYIQVNATSGPAEFLTMLEAVATAVAEPATDKETLAKLKIPLLEQIAELENDPAYVADRAVAERLLGTFPYGRPQLGTAESVAAIDFADLIFAKERLFTADNATVVISGNIDPALVLRAAKRYFGAWRKADKKVPSTFTQPGAPAQEMEIIESPKDSSSEFRFASRGVARSDAARHSASILALILDERIKEIHGTKAFVNNTENTLPGIVHFGISDWYLGQIKKVGETMAVPDTNDYQSAVLSEAVTEAEFNKAKSLHLANIAKANILDRWLDADTFKIDSPKTESEAAPKTTLSAVRSQLEKLRKQPFAYVLVFADKSSEGSPAADTPENTNDQ